MDRAERLAIFKRILLQRAMHPQQESSQLSPEMIQTAVQMGMQQALSNFANDDGALRIAETKGVRPYGGG